MSRRVRYLSGTTSRELEALAAEGADVGLLIQPATRYLLKSVHHYSAWAADNGCFSVPIDSICAAERYLMFLGEICALSRELQRSCLFVVVPDVPFDMTASWERSEQWLYVPRMLGMPVALALQDGAELHVEMWERSDEWDVAFIGGSTEWKMSTAALECCREAGTRGKPIHIGRVNSGVRMERAWQLGAASVDGTFLTHAGGAAGADRLARWLRARNQGDLFGDPAWWAVDGDA